MSRGFGSLERDILAAIEPGLRGWMPLILLANQSEYASDSTASWRRALHGLEQQEIVDVAYAAYDGRRRTFFRGHTSGNEKVELVEAALADATWKARKRISELQRNDLRKFEYQLPEGRTAGKALGRTLEAISRVRGLSVDREGRKLVYPDFDALLKLTVHFVSMSEVILVNGEVEFDTWWKDPLCRVSSQDLAAIEQLESELRNRTGSLPPG